MAEKKSTFVDTIQEATRQRWRLPIVRTLKSAAVDKPRLSRWPPPRQAAWRLDLLKPWKNDD